jgi:hypothetical protein
VASATNIPLKQKRKHLCWQLSRFQQEAHSSIPSLFLIPVHNRAWDNYCPGTSIRPRLPSIPPRHSGVHACIRWACLRAMSLCRASLPLPELLWAGPGHMLSEIEYKDAPWSVVSGRITVPISRTSSVLCPTFSLKVLTSAGKNDFPFILCFYFENSWKQSCLLSETGVSLTSPKDPVSHFWY